MESYLLLLGAQGCVCIVCQRRAHTCVTECVSDTSTRVCPHPWQKEKPSKQGKGWLGAAGCAGASGPRVPPPCPSSRTVGSGSVVSTRTSSCVL